jgi:PTS system fructose-specific IIA component/PTS system nitrogen regulatory IIA component
MRFKDFLIEEATIGDLNATDMRSAIEEMVDALIDKGALKKKDRKKIVDSIIGREEMGSTGIGGLSMPHARIDNMGKLVGVFARSRKGVDFKSLDGEPVYLFFMLISGPEEKDKHLQALKLISYLSHDTTICNFLKMARTADEINSTLDEVQTP